MAGSKKDLYNRINAIGSIMQITNAMKFVAASKIRKVKLATNAAEDYYKKSLDFLSIFSQEYIDSIITKNEEGSNKNLLIVLGSNKGLCGSFNSAMARMLRREIDAGKYTLFTMGKKIKEILDKNFDIFKEDDEILNDLSFDKVVKIYDYLSSEYRQGKYQNVYIAFNYLEKGSAKPKIDKLLPIKVEDFKGDEIDNFIFEPNSNDILKKVVDNYLTSKIYYAIYKSILSENTARMIAMYQATENASKLKSELTTQYNKIRQSSITNQILEIVSASEAVNG